MRSFPSLFCPSPLILRLAVISLFCLLILPPAAAQQAVYLGRDKDGRQLFKIGSLTAALSPGDRVGPCVVGEAGLNCPSPSDVPSDTKAASAKAGCDALLRRQEEKFQTRYLQSLKEYTENLRRKNYELVEKNRQLQKLRAQLGKKTNREPTAESPANNPTPAKSD